MTMNECINNQEIAMLMPVQVSIIFFRATETRKGQKSHP